MHKTGHQCDLVLMGLGIYGRFHVQSQNSDGRRGRDLTSGQDANLSRVVRQGFHLAPSGRRIAGSNHLEVQPTWAFKSQLI